MKKQLRRTLWGMLIVLAAMLTVSLTVGLTAGPGWASTTGVRISVENVSSDKTFVVEYVPSDNPGHNVEILQPNGFARFSDEATAWVANEKTYRYKIKIYPTVELASPRSSAGGLEPGSTASTWDRRYPLDSRPAGYTPAR